MVNIVEVEEPSQQPAAPAAATQKTGDPANSAQPIQEQKATDGDLSDKYDKESTMASEDAQLHISECATKPEEKVSEPVESKPVKGDAKMKKMEAIEPQVKPVVTVVEITPEEVNTDAWTEGKGLC